MEEQVFPAVGFKLSTWPTKNTHGLTCHKSWHIRDIQIHFWFKRSTYCEK